MTRERLLPSSTVWRGEASTGRHSRTSLPDVTVAATAAEHGLTVLHYDSDYERLAEVTGAAQERVAPRGEGHGSS